MSTGKMLEKSKSERHSVWGYDFQWTEQHISVDGKHPMKFSYDRLGEEALERLNIISPPAPYVKSHQPTNTGSAENADVKLSSRALEQPVKRDLYELLRSNAANDRVLGRLWEQVNYVPEWVDWDQIERGQQVFYRYAVGALTGLAFQGLVGGMVLLTNSNISSRAKLIDLPGFESGSRDTRPNGGILDQGSPPPLF